MSEYFSVDFEGLVGAERVAQLETVIGVSNSPVAFQARQLGALPFGIEEIVTTIVTPHKDCEWGVSGQTASCLTHGVTLIG